MNAGGGGGDSLATPPPPLENNKNIFFAIWVITVEDWYNHQISNLLQQIQRKQNNEQM